MGCYAALCPYYPSCYFAWIVEEKFNDETRCPTCVQLPSWDRGPRCSEIMDQSSEDEDEPMAQNALILNSMAPSLQEPQTSPLSRFEVEVCEVSSSDEAATTVENSPEMDPNDTPWMNRLPPRPMSPLNLDQWPQDPQTPDLLDSAEPLEPPLAPRRSQRFRRSTQGFNPTPLELDSDVSDIDPDTLMAFFEESEVSESEYMV